MHGARLSQSVWKATYCVEILKNVARKNSWNTEAQTLFSFDFGKLIFTTERFCRFHNSFQRTGFVRFTSSVVMKFEWKVSEIPGGKTRRKRRGSISVACLHHWTLSISYYYFGTNGIDSSSANYALFLEESGQRNQPGKADPNSAFPILVVFQFCFPALRPWSEFGQLCVLYRKKE